MSICTQNPLINCHFEFSSKGGKVFQLNSWQSFGVAQTLIELERRLGSEWYQRYANCRDKRIDYVLVYKESDATLKRKEARDRYEARLLDDNLEIVRWRKSDCWELEDDESDEVFVLIHTPFDRLALECESVKFEMPLKGQSHPRLEGCCSMDCLRTDNEVDFVTAPFSLARLSIYENSDNLKDFFQPAIASFLTHHILMNTDSEEEDQIQRGTTTKGLSHLLHTKVYSDAFILHPYSPNDPINTTCTQMVAHDICLHSTASHIGATHREKPDLRQELADTWCQWFKFQPMWKIRNYFGEKLAFYFAWLGLLTSSLIIPTVLGSGVFVFGVTYSSSNRNLTNYYDWMSGCFDNRATPVFALIMCVWGTLFLELWKRKHSRLQFEWDVDHYDENEPDRPQFYGTTVVEDPVTKLQEVLYPPHLKKVKFAASVLIVFTMVLVVLASLVGVIVYRLIFEYDWLGENQFQRVPGDELLPILTASVLNGISILVLKLIYNRLALKLTNWENHRTQSAYEDSLVVKLFAFHFADSYASLFYIAFFRNAKFSDGVAGLGNKYHDSCGNNNDCMTMLTIQVTVLMLMQPLPRVIMSFIWPWVKKKWRGSRKLKMNRQGAALALHYPHKEFAIKVHQVAQLVEQQRQMQKLDNFHLTEYSEKVIMYGYLMIFATAFPLAPLIALLTNKFDLRLDAKRLVWHTRRPVAEIAHTIGVWQQVLLFINVVAVVSNGFLIAFTSDFGKEVVNDYGEEGRVWLLVVFEHVVFIFMFLVSVCIPDIPQDVKDAKRRDKVVVDQMTQEYAFESLQREYDFMIKRPSNIEIVRRSADVSLKSFDDEDWLSQ